MADELDDDVFVVENGLINNQNEPFLLEHGFGDNNHDEVENEFMAMGVHDQAIEVNFEDEIDEEMLDFMHEGFQGVGNHHNGFDAVPEEASSSGTPSSSAPFDQSEFLGTSSPTPGMSIGAFVNLGYQSDTSGPSELSSEIKLSTSPACSDETTPGTRHVPETLNKVETQDSASSYGDSGERRRPKPPSSPASPGSNLDDSGNLIQISETRVLLERGMGASQGGSRNDRVQESSLVQPSQHRARPKHVFIKFGSCMVILVLLFPLGIIACLQGILPEKYTAMFLALLVLSVVGACYFFTMYIQVCQSEDSKKSATRTVRYGST